MDRPSFLLFELSYQRQPRSPIRTRLPRAAVRSHKNLLQTPHSLCRMVGCPLEYLAAPPQQIGQRLAGYVGISENDELAPRNDRSSAHLPSRLYPAPTTPTSPVTPQDPRP